MAFICRFVTAIGETGDTPDTLRLDLTPMDPAPDYRRVQLGEDADWGWPQLETVYAQGAGRDGQIPVASHYNNCRVTLPIVYTDRSTPDQRRAALNELAAELDRDLNVLYVQPEDAAEGRWLVTYRAADVAAELRTYGPPDAGLTVQFDRAPFAYGPLETELPWSLGGPGGSPDATSTLLGVFAADLPVSEGAAPTTTAPGGQWYRQVDPAAIKGDVDAPLNLVFTPPPSGTIGDRSIIVATRHVRWDDSDSIRYHLTSTAGATANAPNGATDSDSSGGDAAKLTSAAVLNSWYAVMSGNLPGISGGGGIGTCRELRGRWRVYARARAGTSGGTFELQAGWGGSQVLSGVASNPTQRGLFKTALVPSRVTSTTYSLVNLGVMELPAHSSRETGNAGVPPKVREPLVGLYARRTAGTGTLDVDYMIAVPADGRLAVLPAVYPFGALSSPYQVTVDGDANYVAFQYVNGGEVTDHSGLSAVPFTGGLPRVSPRYPTQLFIIPEVGDANGLSADMSRPLAVTASYRPRYLSVV